MENFLHLRDRNVRVWEHIFYKMMCIACVLNNAIDIFKVINWMQYADSTSLF